MNHSLNREILRLSIPSILANITVPLVGMADTAIAGHIQGASATYIGAISVGAVFFSLLYWSFGFLRTGTGGLSAQAYGRGEMHDCATVLIRAVVLALGVAVLALSLQLPFMKLVSLIVDASEEAKALASDYFFIRIWAAPATLALMSFRGWFVGMQDSLSSMWTDLVINVINIAASLMLTFGIGDWQGLGFDGIATGTVIAQYCGLAFCLIVCRLKYKKVLATFHLRELRSLLSGSKTAEFFKMNADLLGRSFFFISIYVGYTMLAAHYGDLWLSCSSIMMQLLMLFSYVTDGFAYAGEALTGRFIGARQKDLLRQCVRYVFVWSMALTAVFVLFYVLAGMPMLRLMTSDTSVVEACKAFLPWLVLMPPLGCAAFTWDGIFLGATSSKALRNSMAIAAVAFFTIWYVGVFVFSPVGEAAIHLLLTAYFAHLLARTIYLSVRHYKGDVYLRIT